MSTAKDRAQSVAEYIVSVLFVFGGISLIFADPLIGVDGILGILAGRPASLIYATTYISLGCGLIFAKLSKRKRLHKHLLMAMYLTTVFTFFLEWAIIGWSWYLIDSPLVGGVVAMCWLRWKFRTEYIQSEEFIEEIVEIQKHYKIDEL